MANLSPTFNVVVSLEAARDAVNFVNARSTQDIDLDLLVDAMVLLYRSVGMAPEEARLLYLESIGRYSERLLTIHREWHDA